MPNFQFTAPDGKSYSVQGPDGSTPEQAFQILQTQIGGAQPAAAPVSANNVARSAAEGVPIIGGALNQLDAATNATLAPLLNRFFDEKDQLKGDWSERRAQALKEQNAMSDQFAEQHPVVDTAAKLAGGVAAMGPVMAAAPETFGLTGPMSTMIRNGAASNAAISAADAGVRGEDPLAPAAVGGIIGGAAGPLGRGVGKVVSAIADRVRPAPPVPQNVVDVGGVKVPLSGPEVSQSADQSREAQANLSGIRGKAAQDNALGFKDLQADRVNAARDNIAAGLDSTGASASTSPQDAAEKIAAELVAQEQARQAAQAGVNAGPMSPAQHAGDLANAMTGTRNVLAPDQAAEVLSDRLAAGRNAAKADYRGKYDLTAKQPGEFAPGSAAGFRNDIESGLANADRPVSLDPTNTPLSLKGLDVLDERMNAAGPGRVVGDQHAKNVADISAKYGPEVAAKYDQQAQAAGLDRTTQNAPTAQSLLQFIASKGGLGPDAELEAIGAHGHLVNVDGVGRRSLVKQGGWPLDYAREAAEEAGYLRGENGATSTQRDFLDAIDAELRGQKRYPEGFEGTIGKREGAAQSEREQAEYDRHMQGFEDDLAAAGHGELGPDVKQRAIDLMSREGLDPDSAVEHAMAQLDQEDAAGASAFPGDRPISSKRAETGQSLEQKPGSGFTMRDVDQVRKQLSTLYGDARRRMMAGGSGSDVYALEHIMDQFDARVEKMVADGKFSGDGPAVLKMQQEARAAFADYKQKFAKRGAGDDVGAAVEKILGKFSDTKATPDAVVKLAYGSEKAPGGEMPVKIAQRIVKIFGRDSAEFGTYKQGLFAALTRGEPAEVADRIGEFLNGTKGRLLSQTAFSADERASLARYADRLRGTIPPEAEKGTVATAIRRYTGADGAPAASPQKIINDLMGASGRGTGVDAPLIAQGLKQRLSPEGWAKLRVMAFKELTDAGAGKIPYEAQALSQRMHEFLNEGGSQLAKVLYSPQELDLMRKMASVYKQMIPVKGTTNPSGTAQMLGKMASGFRHALLPLLGLTHGGLPGAAIAIGADKAATAIGNANNARKATELFYGPQARRAADPRFARGLGLLSQGSQPAINQARRSK